MVFLIFLLLFVVGDLVIFQLLGMVFGRTIGGNDTMVSSELICMVFNFCISWYEFLILYLFSGMMFVSIVFINLAVF